MFQGMEYMYVVYEEKSFSKAAKRLFISQPSLSATVKRIEERLGYPVFDRSSKPLKLTEFGKKYIDSVEKIMSVENQFSDFLNDWGGLQTGRLILGGSSLFSSWVLPPFMGKFSQKYPLVKIELIEESTTELAVLLQTGKIDLLIDNCILDDAVFDRSIFQEEHLLLAVPERFEVNKELEAFQIPVEMIKDGSFLNTEIKTVPVEKFRDEPFIMLKPENDTGKRAVNIFQEHGLAPRIIFELDQQMTSYNITCSGMGISFISDTLITRAPSHENVVYYKLPGENSHRSIYFYWKRGRYFSRAMKEFLEIAKSESFKKSQIFHKLF